MQAVVPGDILSDLEKAGLIGNPLYELNFKNSTLWMNYTWMYSVTFAVEESLLTRLQADMNTGLLLVFDGIKMAATISLNGQLIGNAADQFDRYQFSLSDAHRQSRFGLLKTTNILSVTFDPARNISGRFMACTGVLSGSLRAALKRVL